MLTAIWRKLNPEKMMKIHARNRQFYKENSEMMRERKRLWYSGSDKAKTTAKRWYAKNRKRLSAAAREIRRNYPDKVRDGYLRRHFGISLSEYNELMSAQGGRCCICKNKFGVGVFAHLDHNHEHRYVRSILCSRCNQGLGMFRESADILMTAIAYLDFYRTHEEKNNAAI